MSPRRGKSSASGGCSYCKRSVRAHAIGLAGRWVHTNATVKAVLLTAMGTDPSPAVRKKASWLVPGGAIYQRTAPKPRRPVERKTVAT